jgi:hypothetical protein
MRSIKRDNVEGRETDVRLFSLLRECGCQKARVYERLVQCCSSRFYVRLTSRSQISTQIKGCEEESLFNFAGS